MDFLSHINLGEMLGDLTVTTFLILLAASIVVVVSMVMFPLIDLAFEKKVDRRLRQHEDLMLYDDSWRTGRPWLVLRAKFLRQLMSGLPPAQRRHVTLVHDSDQFPQSRHRTPLIKRADTDTQTSRPSNAA
jgi:hypothetical protein